MNDPAAPARVRRYQLFLGGLALVALAMLLRPRLRAMGAHRPEPVSLRVAERAAAAILAVAVVAVTWVWLRPRMPSITQLRFFAGLYGALPDPSPVFHAVALIGGAVALPLLVRVTANLPPRTWWQLLAASCALVTLPGLFEPIL